MKKLAAILTALILTLTLSVSASAAYVSVFSGAAPSEQDAAFEALEDEAAITLISLSYSVQRVLIYDAEAFAAAHGFEALKPGFKDTYTRTELLDIFAGYYGRLMNIDRSALSDRNKFEYDFMKEFLECQEILRGTDELITTELKMESGLSDNIKVPFLGPKRSEQDIKDIMDAMAQFGDYITEMCDRELARLAKGYAPTPPALAREYAACAEFIASDGGELMEKLEAAMEEAGLPEETKAAYRAQMSDIKTAVVIPAFNKIIDTVSSITASGVEPLGYACYEGGERYFEYLMRMKVGINADFGELIAGTQEFLADARAELAEISSDPEKAALMAQPAGEFLDGMTIEEIIDFIMKASADCFEPPVASDFSIAPIPTGVTNLQGRLSLKNIGTSPRDFVYTLMAAEPDPENKLPYIATLAHEGIPGHLYNYAYINKDLSLFHICAKLVYNTGLGFTEGWATYVEDYAYKFAGANDVQRQALSINTIAGQCSGEAMSLMINGTGMTFEDFYVMSGYSENPEIPEEAAKSYYYLLLEDPWDFVAYYEGWNAMRRARETAEARLSEQFSEKDFHHFLMELGAVNFDTLEKWENVWTEKTLAANAAAPAAPEAPAAAETSEAPETSEPSEAPDTSEASEKPAAPAVNPPTGAEENAAVIILFAAAAAAALSGKRRKNK